MSFIQGSVLSSASAIDNEKIKEMSSKSLEAGKSVSKVLRADEEKSHENKLVIDDSEGKGNIINRTIKFIGRVVGTLGVFALVIGGFFMIISNGDEQRLSKGKSILMYTIGGLIVTFMAYIIVQYVLSIIYSI